MGLRIRTPETRTRKSCATSRGDVPQPPKTGMKRRSGAERAGEFDAEAAAPRAAPAMKRGGTAKAKRGSVEAMLWSQGPPQQLRERFGTMNAREMMRRYKEAKRQVRV